MISRSATDGIIDAKSSIWTVFVDNKAADLYETDDGKTMLMVHGQKPIVIATQATIDATAKYEAEIRAQKYAAGTNTDQGTTPVSQTSVKEKKGHQKHSKGFEKNMKAALRAALQQSR